MRSYFLTLVFTLAACTPAIDEPISVVDNTSLTEPSVEAIDTPAWVADLFRAVDSMDADGFVGFMAEDVFFRNGSAEPLRGRDAARNDISSLYARIKGINHLISETWVHGNVVVIHGTVTYTRPDGSTLTVPFADIWKMKGDLIQEYMIFMDSTKL